MTRMLLLPLLALAAPVLAADPPPIGSRVDRLERELRAVQRKVFPAGAPAFSEPEIAPAAVAAPVAGTPASAPIADLTSRVDGLEREVQRLTNSLEQDEHRLSLLSEQAAKDRAEFDSRLKALEAGAPGVAAVPAAALGAVPVPATPAPRVAPSAAGASPFRTPPTTRTRPPPAAVDDTGPAPAAPAAAAAPASADPAEAGYMAGYRLWADKKYPEAEAALARVVQQYPKHRRASYARNLLGRAYLDDGQPAEAARALYANYHGDPRGERAPESLFYLGSALTQLKKTDDACRAYNELQAVYGANMGETLRGRLPAARRAAGCAADGAAAATADEDAPAPRAKAVPKSTKKGR